MDAIMTAAREFTYLEAGLRILMAIVLGGMIGMERGLKNRPAGLRTYMLVCLGACIVMLTNQYVYEAFGVGDPVRMGAQVDFTPDGEMRVDPRGIQNCQVTFDMVRSLRASYYLLGALLGRYKEAAIALPGGCAIGQRPICLLYTSPSPRDS